MRRRRDHATRSRSRESHRNSSAEYMASPRWFARRDRWINEFAHRNNGAQPSCEVCAAPWRDPETGHTLDVHHHTYERLGNELFSDLAALCRPHHEAVHRAFDVYAFYRRMPRDKASRALISRLRARNTA